MARLCRLIQPVSRAIGSILRFGNWLTKITEAIMSQGDGKLAAISYGSLEATVTDYRGHIHREHGPVNQALLQRHDATLMSPATARSAA
jgi:hypothetical protein